jgi:alanine dehydrogenase
MNIGIPREIKPLEGRVALTPAACQTLIQAGHRLWVQAGAGLASGFTDEGYKAAGAEICTDAQNLYREGEFIVKVKEPWGSDLDYLQAHHRLFCFLHLAAAPQFAQRLADIGLTAIAFETLERNGGLPLLAPMSQAAGKITVQYGTTLLHRPQGGRGVLLGGLEGAAPGNVVVLGAGHAGTTAAVLAARLGANVTLLDINEHKLDLASQAYPGIETMLSNEQAISALLPQTDLLVGAILSPGDRAPVIVSRTMVETMPEGAVISDIAIDQGGCIATSRPTSWDAPVYQEAGVLHFCVTNMPGAVPRSATEALTAVLLPEVMRLAEDSWNDDAALEGAVNVRDGRIVDPVIIHALSTYNQ